MRLIMVNTPEGRAADVARIAYSVDIEKVSFRQVESLPSDGKAERRDVIDIETSTPLAKKILDALFDADFYSRENFTISVRQPRAIVSKTPLGQLTAPFAEPATDVLEEIFQFSYITTSFVGRVAVAACLIAYGMIEQKILLLVAGLLVLPLTPLLLAFSFGARSGVWNLAKRGALAFVLVAALLFLGGVAVAAVSEPPVKYNDFNTLLVSLVISVGVGIAAGLSNIDDAGQRQLIGLAAAAQIALVPIWFGIRAVFGFPGKTGNSEIIERGASFFLNTVSIIVVSFVVYTLTGAANRSLDKMQES